jgi:hypothetical protein
MLKRFILWDYPRASWQYDVMVGIIVIFVLLTPRGWFRDQPELLSGLPKDQQTQKVRQLLKRFTHQKEPVVDRIEPIADSEGETRGYMVFAKP